MKRMVKYIPLILAIIFLAYSVYVYITSSGLKLLELNSSLGLFYASTYKYAACLGLFILLIYGLLFTVKKRKARK